MAALADAEEFADALLADIPARPAEQQQIVATNRTGHRAVPA
jgi:hypothetical protein